MTHRQAGFTLIEMIIVLIVIVVLTVLGTAGFSSYQVNARDTERESDIAAIQRGLEGYYKNGNPYLANTTGQGGYPGANEFIHIMGFDWNSNPSMCQNMFVPGKCHIVGGYPIEVLPGTTAASLKPPGDSTIERLRTTWYVPDRTPTAILNDGIEAAIDKGQYVYKPMNTTNFDTCYEGRCPRYALIYKKEATGEIVIVKSKRQ